MSRVLEGRSGTEESAGFPVAEIGNTTARHSTSHAEARDELIREVSSWTGVTLHDHRFGGVEFRVGRREIGHLHATIADLPFPRAIRDELIAAGRARPHHVLPNSGWVTVPMRTDRDAANVIELFRYNYERAAKLRASA